MENINMINTSVLALEKVDMTPVIGQMKSGNPSYISISEYFQKYGEENIIQGFNMAEIKNEILVLNAGNKEAVAKVQNKKSNEPNDVFLSLKEGKFLGMEILKVSDLPPDDIHFSVALKADEHFMPSIIPTTTMEEQSPLATAKNSILEKPNYTVYYSNYKPTEKDFETSYEPTSGSYVYKYSLSWQSNYLCSVNVTFNNTQLKCGTQSNNMYTYVNAMSNSQAIDFGLMANPSSSFRNKGMYACYYPKGSKTVYVETSPKVAATSYGNDKMTLENKTVSIKLSVGSNKSTSIKPGEVEMYIGVNGTCIYYKVLDDDLISNLVSGVSGTPLTFLQAMSCLEKDNNDTKLTSGSYFKNVTFSDAMLYSYESSSARRFSTYGAYTYYVFECKPSKVDFNYGNDYEAISINYN